MWLRSIWYVLTLRCDEADRLRCTPDPDALSRHERIAERLHRGLCANCRKAAHQLEAIDRGLRDLATRGDEEDRWGAEWDADRAARLESRMKNMKP